MRRETSLLGRCDERMPLTAERRHSGGAFLRRSNVAPRARFRLFRRSQSQILFVRVAFPSSAARPFTARLFFVNLIPRGNCWQLYDPWRLRARRRWQHFIHLCPPRKDFFTHCKLHAFSLLTGSPAPLIPSTDIFSYVSKKDRADRECRRAMDSFHVPL